MPQHLVLVTSLLSVGGVERHHLRMLDELRAHGWTASVIVTVPGEHAWYDEYARRSTEIVLLYEDDPARGAETLAAVVRERSAEVLVVSNSELGYILLPYVRSVSPGTTVIDVLHNFPAGSDGLYVRMSVDHEADIDMTVAVGGSFLATWMRDHGRTRNNIVVCHDGIDVDTWKPDATLRVDVRRSLGVDDGETLCSFVGRLSEEKRPLLAVSVVERLIKTGTLVRAVLAGDGPEREEVERAIARADVGDRIRYEGTAAPDRVRALLCASDICLQTSKYEGLSVALMEAMACGVCVVAPDVGGQRDLVGGDAGVLVPRTRGEDDRYVDVLRSLVNDPQQRRAFGQRAREIVVANFDAKANMRRLRGVIEAASMRHELLLPTPEKIAESVTAAQMYLQLVEPSAISRRVEFRAGTERSRPERAYRALRTSGRPVYRWARKYLKSLDVLNDRLKRWVIRSSNRSS